MSDTGRTVYERGQEQGRTDARLNVAEEHLRAINGSIGTTGDNVAELTKELINGLAAVRAEMAEMRALLTATITAQVTALAMQAQRLTDQQDAAAATAKTVATTLKDADAARYQHSEQRLSPRMRMVTIVSSAVGAVGVLAAIVFGIRG